MNAELLSTASIRPGSADCGCATPGCAAASHKQPASAATRARTIRFTQPHPSPRNHCDARPRQHSPLAPWAECLASPNVAATDALLYSPDLGGTMKRSIERFLTTHTGSLPRPDDLIRMMYAKEEGVPIDRAALSARVRSAVAEVVKKQADA